jgi:hypothetical protein
MRAPYHEGLQRHPESLTEDTAGFFRAFLSHLKNGSLFVVAGLVPAIHGFVA